MSRHKQLAAGHDRFHRGAETFPRDLTCPGQAKWPFQVRLHKAGMLNIAAKRGPVTVDNQRTIPSMLEFFMGKNTPERRSYIMQNLV